ncbi:MAG: ABC transporter transmembrane domain-containing protein [Candidatus Paceibacterota bacterium]
MYNFFAPLVVFVGVLIVLFNQNKTLGLIFLVWIILFVFLSISFAKRKAPVDEEMAAQSSATTALMSDSILNVLNIKIFAQRNFESKKYAHETTEEYKKRGKRSWEMNANQNLIQSLLAIVLEVVSLLFVVSMWQKGLVTVGFFVLVQAYMSRIFDFIWCIGRAIKNFGEALSSAKEMVEILDQRN